MFSRRGGGTKISGNASAHLSPSATGKSLMVDFGVDDTQGYKTLKYNVVGDYANINALKYRGSDGVVHDGTYPTGTINISNYTSILVEGQFTSDSSNSWHRSYVYYELS